MDFCKVVKVIKISTQKELHNCFFALELDQNFLQKELQRARVVQVDFCTAHFSVFLGFPFKLWKTKGTRGNENIFLNDIFIIKAPGWKLLGKYHIIKTSYEKKSFFMQNI